MGGRKGPSAYFPIPSVDSIGDDEPIADRKSPSAFFPSRHLVQLEIAVAFLGVFCMLLHQWEESDEWLHECTRTRAGLSPIVSHCSSDAVVLSSTTRSTRSAWRRLTGWPGESTTW